MIYEYLASAILGTNFLNNYCTYIKVHYTSFHIISKQHTLIYVKSHALCSRKK